MQPKVTLRKLTIPILMALLLLTTSCHTSGRKFRILAIDTTIKAESISYLQLARNYRDYQGKYVDVKGLFSQEFEHFGICPEPAVKAEGLRCFWLNLNKDLNVTESDLQKMNFKVVRIKGLLDTTTKGHLSSYYGTIRQIYFWELQ